jgi:hypothetical protein
MLMLHSWLAGSSGISSYWNGENMVQLLAPEEKTEFIEHIQYKNTVGCSQWQLTWQILLTETLAPIHPPTNKKI